LKLNKRKILYRDMGVRRDNSLSKIFYMMSFIPLTYISAFRYGVGTDYFGYVKIYNGDGKSTYEYVEGLFKLFTKILNIISDNPQLFFFASSLFIIGSYYRMIYMESQNYSYSILLFVLTNDYFRSMNTVRQYIAMAIAFIAIPYIKKKNWKVSLILLVIACNIHMSVLIMVVFYILYLLDLKPTAYIVISALLYIGGSLVKNVMFPLISRFTEYGRYFSEKSGYSSGDFSTGFFLIYLSFGIMMIILYKKTRKSDNLKLLYTASFMGIMISILSMYMTKNFSRLVYYMNIYVILYSPEMISNISSKNLRRIIGLAIILCYIGVTIPLILKGNQTVLPYRSIWSN
jgi:hypothetical protein